MKALHAESSRTIAAPPEAIYALLRNYRELHPRVLPGNYFKEFRVIEGGCGAGTRFKTAVTVMGQTREYDMDVTEPQPLTLVETDRLTGLKTTFVVATDPIGARVTIATDWSAADGIKGWLEALTAPAMMKRIYEEELALIEKVAMEFEYRSELNGAQ